MDNMDVTAGVEQKERHRRHHGRRYKLKRWVRDKRNNTMVRLVLLYLIMIAFFCIMVLLSKVL
jgi:hypothetical protein